MLVFPLEEFHTFFFIIPNKRLTPVVLTETRTGLGCFLSRPLPFSDQRSADMHIRADMHIHALKPKGASSLIVKEGKNVLFNYFI